MTYRRNGLFVIILVIVALLVIFTRGVFMKLNYTLYKGDGLTFEYPKIWTLRESKGATEEYFQVHVFGNLKKDIGFGPSVTLTVYPKKESGGQVRTLQEFIKRYLENVKKIKGYKPERDEVVSSVSQVLARDVEMSFLLRLPLYQTNAQDVLIRERTLFFERGQSLYVLSYKNLSQDYSAWQPVFKRVIQTLRFQK